jgi:hypothetical protein
MGCDDLADGSIVECGTRLGGMLFGMVDLCHAQEFDCFDSFEAMPAAGDRDGLVARDLQESGGLLSIDDCLSFIVKKFSPMDKYLQRRLAETRASTIH